MDFFDLFAETKEIVKPSPRPPFLAEYKAPYINGNEMQQTVIPKTETVPSIPRPKQESRPDIDNCIPLKPPMSLAMATIPQQGWCRLYEPQMALERGTIFPDLDFPFLGKEGVVK